MVWARCLYTLCGFVGFVLHGHGANDAKQGAATREKPISVKSPDRCQMRLAVDYTLRKFLGCMPSGNFPVLIGICRCL